MAAVQGKQKTAPKGNCGLVGGETIFYGTAFSIYVAVMCVCYVAVMLLHMSQQSGVFVTCSQACKGCICMQHLALQWAVPCSAHKLWDQESPALCSYCSDGYYSSQFG